MNEEHYRKVIEYSNAMGGAWLRGEGEKPIALNLIDANLSNADLSSAKLYRAKLYRANLTGANLHRADLGGASLIGANLTRANLTGATLDDVTMNWESRTLIGERLRQAAGDDYSRLALAGAIANNPGRGWDYWLTHTPLDLRDWALSVMRTWVKDGDNAPDILWEVSRTPFAQD